ncbi:ATP-grasp domain-containing protein [Methylomonas sp. AM2-LC]|uniref:ATP-grasp domain-containing protein n=1 Tax=Methylomonas sp. AM2-LC TaxID=3153301 RepID=UPI00326629A3
MKILVFEYICGGGFADQALPSSLAIEGCLMLQALTDDLGCLENIQLLIPLDQRCQTINLPTNAEIVYVQSQTKILTILPELIAQCDAVWPIAPETNGILTCITELVKRQNKLLLASPPDMVALCSNKLKTYQVLSAHNIPCVETQLLNQDYMEIVGRSVVKPIDSCGCQDSIIIEANQQLSQKISLLNNSEQYIIQPFMEGQATSLSCLFKQGKAWLLCCNQQLVAIENQAFNLKACLVNTSSQYESVYLEIIADIATALPSLWGYIGIDFIETTHRGPLLLEINPRLTSSYIGIRKATGINVAAQVLSLISAEPSMPRSQNGTVTVKMLTDPN